MPRRLPSPAVCLTAILALPVLAFAYAGSFARYVADDFCTASVLFEQGFVGAQQFWYLNWSGRFSFIFLIDVLNSLGPWTVPLTPAVLLAAWLLATDAALRPLLRQLSAGRAGLWPTLPALLLIVATLGTSPDVWQSLYWQTGSVTYLLPVVLLTAYAAMLWRVAHAWSRSRWRTAGWLIAGAALLIAAVGCSETAMGMVVGALAPAAAAVGLVSRSPRRRVVLTTLALGVLIALLASAAVIAAPGNALRGEYFQRPPLLLALVEAAWYPFLAVATLLIHAPAYVVLAYGLPFWAARQFGSPRVLTDRAWCGPARRAVMVGGFAAIAAAGAPAFYIGGAVPPPRAAVIPQAVLIATLIACGLLDGLSKQLASSPTRIKHQAMLVVAGLALTFGPLLTLTQTLSDAADLKIYAVGLDQIDHQARQAHAQGILTLSVPRPTQPALVDLAELGSNSSQDPNRCMSAYYGLSSLVASQSTI